MKTKVVGAAAGVGVVALLFLAGTRTLRSSPRPASEPRAETHMWSVLSGELAA
jgi:hypothetical protein